MNDLNQKYIFISYSHKDDCQSLFNQFEKFGYNIVFDDQISYGTNWKYKAKRLIFSDNCVGCVVFLSKNSIISPAVLDEIEKMKIKNKPFMALLINAKSTSELLYDCKNHYQNDEMIMDILLEMEEYFHEDNVFLTDQEFFNMKTITNKLKITFDHWGIQADETKNMNFNQVLYRSDILGEKKRLIEQSNSYKKIDNDAILEVLQTFNRDQLLVVDLGCSNGLVTYDRFKDIEKVSKVIGFDYNEQDIEEANHRGYGDKFSFFTLDLESEDVVEQILSVIHQFGFEKIDIVFSALTLLHLKDPERLLLRLFDCFSFDGKIIVRGSDDGLKLCYPKNELMQEIIQRYAKFITTTDRFNGRKLFSQLQDCGYFDVHMLYTVCDTSRMNRAERLNYFHVGFNYRKNRIKALAEKNPDSLMLKEEYEWFCKALTELEKEFVKPNFWYTLTTFIAIASVN